MVICLIHHCIIISAIASVTAPIAIQRVIDGLENIHSTGDVAVSEDVFKSFAEGTLYPCLIFMAISYTLGNLAMGTYAVALAYIGQDFMHKTRCKYSRIWKICLSDTSISTKG